MRGIRTLIFEFWLKSFGVAFSGVSAEPDLIAESIGALLCPQSCPIETATYPQELL
jgi:hypothetical protein